MFPVVRIAEPVERVSIIVPFFRAGPYLREAIESVLNQQSFTDWHLYLINDGSDDVDVDIARRYCELYPSRMTFLEHEGQRWRGISASRNLGMECSRGEYMAFLDADDTWYSHKLSYQVNALDHCQQADMTYGSALRWNSWNGGVDEEIPSGVDGYGSDCLVPGEALLATYLRSEARTPCTGSVLIRSLAARRVGYFEEQFHGLYDDQVFYAKICRTSQILVSSECLSRYRQHPQSCCRIAEQSNAGPQEREQFLAWLRQYNQRACA